MDQRLSPGCCEAEFRNPDLCALNKGSGGVGDQGMQFLLPLTMPPLSKASGCLSPPLPSPPDPHSGAVMAEAHQVEGRQGSSSMQPSLVAPLPPVTPYSVRGSSPARSGPPRTRSSLLQPSASPICTLR